jgi:hypothetical protein
MLASPQYSFAPWAIKGAPDDPGLFALYRRGELICIGVAKGLKRQLYLKQLGRVPADCNQLPSV